jgi:hypothetical protein
MGVLEWLTAEVERPVESPDFALARWSVGTEAD